MGTFLDEALYFALINITISKVHLEIIICILPHVYIPSPPAHLPRSRRARRCTTTEGCGAGGRRDVYM